MRLLIILLGLLLTTGFIVTPDFLAEQKKYERVKAAYKEKEAGVQKKLSELGLDLNNFNILITVFKSEQELVIYAKNKKDKQYKKLVTYPICASSGDLGPKRKQGDGQVPEGFYHIERYNPSSSYHLSLGVSYPNKSDKLKSTAKDLGGDIFIHGECVTIGCMPMTNDKIKEIYIYAIQAKNNGQQNIPVYIFPFKFTESAIAKHKSYTTDNKMLQDFWNNLKTGYDKFHSNLEALNVAVDKAGNYNF
ncbi:MAG: L,D-transpeptidase family protein [Bacteroidia bacterium]|jgi:murein L,D-transpeptidase YafK